MGELTWVLTVPKEKNQTDFQRECTEAQVAFLALWDGGGGRAGRGVSSAWEKWRIITLEGGKELLPGKQCQGFMLKASKLQISRAVSWTLPWLHSCALNGHS